MSLDMLSNNDKVRLGEFFDAGTKILQDIDDLREALKDHTKALAEEFEVKPALLTRALKLDFKSKIAEAREGMTQVEEILEAVGRA